MIIDLSTPLPILALLFCSAGCHPAWLNTGLNLTFLPYLASGLSIRPTKTKFMKLGEGIDLYQTVNITPKGSHGFTEELCHPFGIEKSHVIKVM